METPSSSSTRAPICAPLLDPSGSLSSNISRCGLRRERAAILEPTEVHREVLPSSAAMARALGFRCVTVLHKTPKGEHGIFGPMKEWGLRTHVLYGEANHLRYLRALPPRLLIFTTFDWAVDSWMRAPANSTHLVAVLDALSALALPPVLVAGCHTASYCVESLFFARARWPRLRFTLMAYHPAMLPVLAPVAYDPPFAAAPVFLGPSCGDDKSSNGHAASSRHRAPRHARDVDEPVRFIVPGNIDFERRDYEQLAALASESWPRPVEIVLFGRCSNTTHPIDHPISACARLARLLRSALRTRLPANASAGGAAAARLTFRHDYGSFDRLFRAMREASFVVPLVDERVGEMLHEYSREGKLSSSVALALAFCRPLVAITELLRPLGLAAASPLEYADSRGLADALRRALNVADDAAAYHAVQASMCSYRADAFGQAVAHLRGLLGAWDLQEANASASSRRRATREAVCRAFHKSRLETPHANGTNGGRAPAHWCVFAQRPISIETSRRCPTREDVFHTRPAERWALWDDAGCAAGCRVDRCLKSGVPCCVRRRKVTWPVECKLLPLGCHGAPTSPFTKMNLSVHDEFAANRTRLGPSPVRQLPGPARQLLPLALAPLGYALLIVAAARLWRAAGAGGRGTALTLLAACVLLAVGAFVRFT